MLAGSLSRRHLSQAGQGEENRQEKGRGELSMRTCSQFRKALSLGMITRHEGAEQGGIPIIWVKSAETSTRSQIPAMPLARAVFAHFRRAEQAGDLRFDDEDHDNDEENGQPTVRSPTGRSLAMPRCELAVLFIVVMIFVVKPQITRLLSSAKMSEDGPSQGHGGIWLSCLSALFTQMIGFALFGAFMPG